MKKAKKEEVRAHNQETLKTLEVGDLVEFDRGFYRHWAVYTGEEEVVEVAGGLDIQDGAELLKSFLRGHSQALLTFIRTAGYWETCGGSKAFKGNHFDTTFTVLETEEIKKRAQSKRNEKFQYNIYSANCEHFANWCRYDQWISAQALEFKAKIDADMARVLAGVLKATETTVKFVGEAKSKVLVADLRLPGAVKGVVQSSAMLALEQQAGKAGKLGNEVVSKVLAVGAGLATSGGAVLATSGGPGLKAGEKQGGAKGSVEDTTVKDTVQETVKDTVQDTVEVASGQIENTGGSVASEPARPEEESKTE